MLTTIETTTELVQSALGNVNDRTTNEDHVVQIVHQVGEIRQAKQALMFFDNKASSSVGSQQVKGICTFCQRSVTSTGATRMVDHLSKDCILVPFEVKTGFSHLHEGFSHYQRVALLCVQWARWSIQHVVLFVLFCEVACIMYNAIIIQ